MKNVMRYRGVLLVSASVLLAAISCAPAATPPPTPAALPTPTPTPPARTPTPTTPSKIANPKVPRITPEEVKQLMDTGVEVTLVDVRDRFKFAEEHIKGAINIPFAPLPPYTWEMIQGLILGLLCSPEQLEPEQLIVLYGD